MSTDLRTPAPPRPMRRLRWWPVLLVLVTIPFIAFSVFVGLVLVSLNGGLDDLFSGDAPAPGDPEVVQAEEAADRALDERTERLAGAVGLPALGEGARRVGRVRLEPSCQVGQHNWKIDDDFDLACDLTRVEVVAAPGSDTFPEQMAALDGALERRGWVDSYSTMDQPLRYWELYVAPGTAPGERPSAGYSLDDLPGAHYEQTVGGRQHRLSVEWAERTSQPHAITYLEDQASFDNLAGGRDTAPGLVAEIPVDGYAVVVTETVEYFRE